MSCSFVVGGDALQLAQLALHNIRVDAALSQLGLLGRRLRGGMLEMGRTQLHRRH